MFVVVCYDIPDDKRRNSVAKALEGFGERVQKSVFECNVSPELYEKMKKRVQKRIKPEEDAVRYYQICQACLKRIDIAGLGKVTEDRPYFII
jgi:CRISPR-associated protein Cas2